MKISIKNMVCDRCNLVLSQVLAEMDLHPVHISLGEVDFGEKKLSEQQIEAIHQRILPLGFEIIFDKKKRLIENIKNAIIELVQSESGVEDIKISDFLKQRFHYEYNYLSNLFSGVEGISIEQYFIHQKIEKVKELLVYDELTLSEISYRLGYSSLAHLSGQFKKVTGLAPSHFKKLKNIKQRQSLDKI